MCALTYTYTTTSYSSTVLPKGPLEYYNKENLPIVSKLLQSPSSTLLSPFGTEVSLYIHHTHWFIYRALPDHPVAVSVLIDINPQNNLVEPDHSLRTTVQGQSKYYLHWDTLPSVIPSYLYIGLAPRAELYNLNLTHLLSELELWWGLLHQNTFTQYIQQTHQLPYLPNTLLSLILFSNHPPSSADPLGPPEYSIMFIEQDSCSDDNQVQITVRDFRIDLQCRRI